MNICPIGHPTSTTSSPPATWQGSHATGQQLPGEVLGQEIVSRLRECGSAGVLERETAPYSEIPSLDLDFSLSRMGALPKSWHPLHAFPLPSKPSLPSLPYLPPAAVVMFQIKGLQGPQSCCPTPQFPS